MGESGSLHTVVNMQQFKQPEPAAVELTIVPANAASIFVEEPFELVVTVKNRSSSPLSSCNLLLPCNTEAAVIALGATEIPIQSLAPGCSTSLTVHMLAVEQGLREVSGICVQDAVTFANYQVRAGAALLQPALVLFIQRLPPFCFALALMLRCRCRRRCLSMCSMCNKTFVVFLRQAHSHHTRLCSLSAAACSHLHGRTVANRKTIQMTHIVDQGKRVPGRGFAERFERCFDSIAILAACILRLAFQLSRAIARTQACCAPSRRRKKKLLLLPQMIAKGLCLVNLHICFTQQVIGIVCGKSTTLPHP
jgi:hypothetical protein